MMWIRLLLSVGTSFAISLLLIPEIIKIAHSKNIHDIPDERKIHKRKTPSFGGIGIFFGFIISTLVWCFVDLPANMQFLLGAVLVMVVVGMRDDFLPLSAFWKLIGQVVAIIILLIGDIRIVSLYGFLGIDTLPDIVSYPLTIFTVIVLTNAFNLIDGIDGLAGSVALIVFGFFGVWFMLEGSYTIAALCLAVWGSVGGFLFYNYSPAKIFMGDTGSLLLGFLVAGLLIIFLQKNELVSKAEFFHIKEPFALLSALLIYPLFDTLRVFILRMLNGRSPLSPDRNHIHHLLLDLGCSHHAIVSIITTTNVVFLVVFAALGQHEVLTDNWLVPLIVLSATTLAIILHQAVAKKKAIVRL